MTAKWLVAKYMPDLRRREPINIGVILITGAGEAQGRFRAVRKDGGVDGRSARWAHSTDNYRQHVAYWRHLMSEPLTDEAIERATRLLGDENYLLEFGGERLAATEAPTDPDALLDRLYAELVEETPDRTNLSVSELSDTALHQLPLRDGAVRRDYRLEFALGDARDAVVFDYRFDNGAVHLMRNVPLTFADQRSWDAVHAALWGFERAAEHPVSSDRPQRYISFIKPREQDSDLSAQLQVLGSQAEVVDVSDPDAAAGQLADIFSLS